MKFKELLERVESSEEFKDFIGKYPDAELCAGFFIMDFLSNDNKETLDYKIGEKVFTFNVKEDKIFVDIKNAGTADLNDADIHVMCSAFGVLRSDTNKTIPAFSDDWIKISLTAGGTGFFYPSLTINVGLYSYDSVDCKIEFDGDPTPNEFNISIP